MLFERHVECVRALVVAPAHVQSHAGRFDTGQRVVDRTDHELDPREEVVEWTIGEQGVPLEREIRRVDLEQQPLIDDVSVLGPQRGRDRAHVFLL